MIEGESIRHKTTNPT